MTNRMRQAEQSFEAHVQPLIDYMNGGRASENKKGWLLKIFGKAAPKRAYRLNEGRDGWPTAVFKIDDMVKPYGPVNRIDYIITVKPDGFHVSTENLLCATEQGFRASRPPLGAAYRSKTGMPCGNTAHLETPGALQSDFLCNAFMRHISCHHNREDQVRMLVDFRSTLSNRPGKRDQRPGPA